MKYQWTAADLRMAAGAEKSVNHPLRGALLEEARDGGWSPVETAGDAFDPVANNIVLQDCERAVLATVERLRVEVARRDAGATA